jgi:cytochrome oxidase Cu insertion factor (SCO1/SenC/PrrC family)
MDGTILSMQLNPRSKFLLLIGVFVVPVVAAYLAYFGWRPAGHTNYGDLVEVVPLQHTAGWSRDGAPLDLQTLRGRWLMVYVSPSACDAVCANLLYLTRQTRIAQGKEQARIERLWVLTDSGKPDPAALQAHPDLHVWRPQDAAFIEQFPAEGARTDHVYLVDPLGNLMLRFPARPEAKRMMKDLKLLLKASQVG